MGAYGSKQFKADLEALRANDPTLHNLNYEQVSLGDEGAAALAEALQVNRTLRRLQLGQCNVSGVGVGRLGRALCENRVLPSKLRRLDLSTSATPPAGNPIGDTGAKNLSYLLMRGGALHHLTAANCGITDEGAVYIAQALHGNRTLRTLDLSYNSISDIGAEQVGSALSINKTLQGLSLWKNRIFHSGAEAVANGLTINTSLKWLGLGCNYIGDEGVKAIAIALLSNGQDSALVWLALGGNEITDKGAEHLSIALRAQQGTTNGTNNEANNNGSGILAETASQVSLLAEQIRSGGLRSMLEMGVTPSHVSMAVEDREVEGEGEEEEEGEEEGGRESYCIPLESLGLGGNQITDVGAASLAEGLANNTRLLNLGLSDNCIGDTGASSLADLLIQTDTLQKLFLSGNNVHDEGGSKLVAALSQNRSLKGLYLAGNPLGDNVSGRCQEVVGKYNNTLETLDVHDTRMSTPAVSSLVESMRTEGVLRSLASQPVPQPGAARSTLLPPSGNILDMEGWRPLSQNLEMPRAAPKHDQIFSVAPPSRRQTTIDALGSLPPPEESAQALVVRAGGEEEGGRRRRSSISRFIGRVSRKGSRIFKKESAYEVDHHYPSMPGMGYSDADRRLSRRAKTSSAVELQPLVEEEEREWGEGWEEDGGVDMSPFRTPTMVVEDTPLSPPPLPDTPPPLPDTPPMAVSGLGGPEQGISARDHRGSSGARGQRVSFGPQVNLQDLDAVERSAPRLSSLTTGHPKPPSFRRPPSHGRSPRHSPRKSTEGGVERMGGITSIYSHQEQEEGEEERERFVYDAANRMLASATPIGDSEASPKRAQCPGLQEGKPLKDQWAVALRQRVGMLKMGGFLHTGFDAITAADASISHSHTHARLPRNVPKNRMDAPLPPSHTRVKLQLVFEEVGSDYINASFVGSPSFPKSFIVTQSPLDSTMADFWRMIWEHRLLVVVYLSDSQEDNEGGWPGVGQTAYYPSVCSGEWVDDALAVTTTQEVWGTMGVAGLGVRDVTIQSSMDGERESVRVLHYRHWPQQGVPSSARDIARLFHISLQARRQQTVASPLLVVSRLGAGRAGCFCAVGVAYELMQSEEESPQCWEQESNILDQVIRGLRRCRGELVGTQQQFEFCHQVLGEVLWGQMEGAGLEGVDGEGQKRTGWKKIFGGRKKSGVSKAPRQKETGKGRRKATHHQLEEEEPSVREEPFITQDELLW